MDEQWTPELMRNALVLAIKVERALPGGGTFRAVKEWDTNEAWGYPDEEKLNRVKFRPSAVQISRMETLLIGRGRHSALINGAVLGYREHRTVLMKWALWVSFGGCAPDGVPETDVEFARRMRMEEWTMKRQRDFAASIMAQQANRDGIVVWHAGKPERRRRGRGNLQAAGT